MSRLVLDASIVSDWLLDDEFDPRASTALTRLRQDGAVVPQLWHYEVRNALLSAERRGRISKTWDYRTTGFLEKTAHSH